MLLTSDVEQSMHGSSRAVAGEFAIVPPFLGSSQRLLNRDHYSVYYKVDSWGSAMQSYPCTTSVLEDPSSC